MVFREMERIILYHAKLAKFAKVVGWGLDEWISSRGEREIAEKDGWDWMVYGSRKVRKGAKNL